MIKNKESLEQIPVSFFLNVKAEKHSDMSVGRVLRGIKNCAYQKEVNNARYFLTTGDRVKYAEEKENCLLSRSVVRLQKDIKQRNVSIIIAYLSLI